MSGARWLAALGAAALLGCQPMASTHYAALAGPAAPPEPPVATTELHIGLVPPRPFREVGLVQSVGYGDDGIEGPLLGALRAEGRRRGCDAIVRVKVDRGSQSSHAIGVCVRWVADQTTRLRPPCLAS